MDKSTLSNYGWVVIVTLVLSVMLAFATPFGSYVAKATANVIKYYKTVTGDTLSADYIEGEGDKWDNYLNDTVLSEDIENSDHMYGIGKTKSEYVIAVFNEDYTSVTIKKNGTDSDGLMKNFDTTEEANPLLKHRLTVKTIIIEEGVVSIGDNALRSYTEATKLILPKGLKRINYCAFNCCEKIQEIVLPNTVEYIGAYAFYACRSVSDLNIPASVSTIERAAFSDLRPCSKITVDKNNPYFNSIDGVLYNEDGTILLQYPTGKKDTNYEVKNTTKEIMDYAFAENEFIKNVVFPEGLMKINGHAFTHTNLESLNLPSTIVSIGNNAFRFSSSINKPVTIPKGLTTIGTAALSSVGSEFIVEDGNPNYKAIDGVLFSKDGTTLLAYPSYKTGETYTVPEGTINIGDYAFLYNYYIKNIHLANTTVSIGSVAINGVDIVITIPISVTNIKDNAFNIFRSLVIRGYAGSTAETYAKTKGYTFVAI